jgi:hypothetical protein
MAKTDDEVTKVKRLFDYMTWELKLSKSKAFKVIFYADEDLGLLKENYELCSNCKELYSSHREGHHCDECEKFLCYDCLHICHHINEG